MNDLDEALRVIRENRDNPNLPVPKSWNPAYSLLPYQRVGVSHLLTKTRFILGDPCGCHRIGQLILMFDGSTKKVEEIKQNDLLMGSDSLPRRVLSLCRGKQEMVQINPKKGDSWVVNLDHILTLHIEGNHLHLNKRNKPKIIDVSVRDWKQWGKTKKLIYKLFKVGVEFPEGEELPIDPHSLGVLLGDGVLKGSISVISEEPEILQVAQDLAKSLSLRVSVHKDPLQKRTPDHRIVGERSGAKNNLIEVLRILALYGTTSGDKFIPQIYKTASRENRLKMLAGIMDTDGHLDQRNKGYFDHVTKSEKLAQDVQFVAHSLGMMATVKPCFKSVGGENKPRPYFRVCIFGKHLKEIPVSLERKQAGQRLINKDALRYGFSIEDLPVEDYYGFTLDGDGRYLLGDFTVTHNTGKTPQELYSWGVLREKRPLRLMVLTTKSATYQWGDEIAKFLLGVPYFVVPSTNVKGGQANKSDRIETYQKWLASGPGSAIILNWSQMVNDWPDWLKVSADQWADHTQLCLDEAQKIKNPETLLHQTISEVLKVVPRAHGLTATLVKNRAHDAYAISNALVPGFMSLDFFNSRYAVYEKKEIYRAGKRGKHKVNQLKEYVNLLEFADAISPFYLARTDDELDLQRPQVVHIVKKVEMSPEHRKIYLDAERGLFLNNPTGKPEESAGASLVHAQLAANTPELFPGKAAGMDDPSLHPDYAKIQKCNSKLELLNDLLDMELLDQPVVIYSHLESSISALEKALARFNPVRVTGKEQDEERANSRHKFMTGKTNLMLITDAGGEALNLQRAKHLIFYSRPYDPGRYVQVVGRIRRFGLDSEHVLLWHLTMIDSIDELVDSIITEKFGPYDEIVRGRSGMMPDTESLPLELVRRARKLRLRSNE